LLVRRIVGADEVGAAALAGALARLRGKVRGLVARLKARGTKKEQ
jgi:hypothetical protein